jgi:hypothetical protein
MHSEDEHQQPYHHRQTDQKDDACRTREKFQHTLLLALMSLRTTEQPDGP